MANSICIRRRQVRLHVVGEALALVAVVPAMAYLATRKELPTWPRVVAGATGLFSLVVDGYLLYQYGRRSPGWWGR